MTLIVTIILCMLGVIIAGACLSLPLRNSPMASEHFQGEGARSPYYAVIISGDGVFTTLATGLAERLAAHGIGVAKTKAITYFWSRRSPQAMSNDLAAVLRRRLRRYPNDEFVLIGYSFGAGTLPFAINRLPDALQARIARVALLAVPKQADFEFMFWSWINRFSGRALLTAPEIQALSKRTSLIYLKGEDDFIGPSVALSAVPSVDSVVLPGGHDFDGDLDHVFALITAPLNLRPFSPRVE